MKPKGELHMFKQKAIVNAVSLDELSEAREMINQCLLEKIDIRINDLKEGFRLLEKKDKEEVEEETEYQKFFKKALDKFGVSSPADFKDDEKKKEFFNYVDNEWKADKEED